MMVLLMVGCNPVNSPVEVASDHPIVSHYLLTGFVDPNGGWEWDFRTINSSFSLTFVCVRSMVLSYHPLDDPLM